MELWKQPVQRLQQNLEKNLTELLEPPLSELVNTSAESFSPLLDLRDMVSTLRLLPTESSLRTPTLFTRLSSFFESGLRLEKDHSQDLEIPAQSELWNPCESFAKGEVVPLSNDALSLSICLPRLAFTEIRRTSPYALLSPLGLTSLCDGPESTALAMRVSQDDLFVLLTNIPEPWLRLHVEKIHQQILQIVSDLD